MKTTRRSLVLGTAALLALPALAASRRSLATMTEGPFYPSDRFRRDWLDQDADLTRVQRAEGVLTARGEHLGLMAGVVDSDGRAIDGVDVEIWQCDVLTAYRHPRVRAEAGSFDPGFQGYGSARSDRQGQLRLRTIKPVAYPGRTPHIHIKLRHASFGELTTQLFVAGEPGNRRDGLWRRVREADREALEMALQPAAAGSGLQWEVRHSLVVPA